MVLAQAGLHALALVDAMAPFIGSTEVLPGTARRRPGERGRRDASTPRTVSSASMLTWPGVTATRGLRAGAARGERRPVAGTTVGNVVVTLGTQQRCVVPVAARGGHSTAQTLLQRLS